MKKIIAFVLCLVMTLAMFGCAGGGSTEPTAKPVETRDYSPYANIAADTQTWYNELMAMPIANENMTEQELRQLCVDAMRMNLTFTWTPTKDISYSFTLLERTSEVFLKSGIAYSGLFYCNNNARGNVWKALEYYDPETGAIDVETLSPNLLSVMSSACARGVEWGWARVCNDTGLENMASYNQYNSNIVLVGTYTYGLGQYSFSSGSGTKDIIAANGDAVMLESYSMMKMADGLYSSSSYHVIMASSDPVVVYDETGAIDPEQSYILINEQDAVGSKTDKKDILQTNGVTLRQLGTVDNKYTFQDLLNKGYVPFTLKELVGQAPVEAGDAWIGGTNDRVENGADLPLDQILSKTLFTNYAICTVKVEIHDPAGNVLLSDAIEHSTTPFTYHVSISNSDFEEDAAVYANGKNTVHVYVRMANGELKEAFTTVLKIS